MKKFDLKLLRERGPQAVSRFKAEIGESGIVCACVRVFELTPGRSRHLATELCV